MQPPLTIISLGWGVQSWTLAAMSALGDLPKVDFAIHSDTTWERQSTYEFAEQWTPWLEQHGVKVITVNDAEQAAQVATAKSDIPACKSRNGKCDNIFIPAFSRYEGDDNINHKFGGVERKLYTTDGANVNGQLRRQCTHRWKIVPMRRWIAAELKRRGLKKSPGIVEQWLGITSDEWTRAKDSDVKYIKHKCPLLDLGMSRGDCLNWLEAHSLPSPGKSSCTFCPYHSKAMWQELKRENGPDWTQAVKIDATIRDKRPPYPLFVHSSRIPLIEAVDIPEDYGLEQLSLFNDSDAECDSGYCFL